MTDTTSLLKEPISGTSILEGMTKAIRDVPKDKRQSLNMTFVVHEKKDQPTALEARLIYTYRDEFGVGGFVTKHLGGDLVGGVVLNWEPKR